MQSDITTTVREKYSAVARGGLSSNDAGVRAVAEAFGYSGNELDSIPAEANMGLSCGNPTASASLREGEVVVDLGCGGGLDVFLAAKRVGPTGKAIGIDMSEEMLALARRNAQKGSNGRPITNVEFHHATIDRLPLPDASVDVVISNCVINLAPDKNAVFREIVRVLKPGGRLAVSDISLKKPLPDEIREDVMAYVGCIAGAILIDDYRKGLARAGFEHVVVVDSGADLNAYAKVENQAGCCAPPMTEKKPAASNSCCTPAATEKPADSGGCCTPAPAITKKGLPIAGASACCSSEPPKSDVHGDLRDLLQRYDVNDYAASVKVYAVKPKT